MKLAAPLALLFLLALQACVGGREHHYEENFARMRAAPSVRLTEADKAAIMHLISRATWQYAYGVVRMEGGLWVLTAEPNESAPRYYTAFHVAKENARWRILARRRMPRAEMVARLDYFPRDWPRR